LPEIEVVERDSVTLRERDSTKQKRIKIDELRDLLLAPIS
jgi:glycyl-tRNA synthetase (class II)